MPGEGVKTLRFSFLVFCLTGLVEEAADSGIIPHHGDRVVEAGFDCAYGDFQGLGDFFEGHGIDEAHEDDFAVGFGEGGEDLGQVAGFERGLAGGGSGEGIEGFVGGGFHAAGFFLQADGEVLDGWVEEGRQAGGEREAGEFGKEVDEGFLGDIEGEIGIGGEAHGQGNHPIAVAVVEGLESAGVAGVGGGDEVLVGGWW